MSQTKVITQKRDATKFRFSQDFTHDNITHAWRRQPYANKLVVGVVEQAIGKGFNVIDTKTKKPLEKNDDIREFIEEIWLDLKKTIHYERAYGQSLGSMFSDNLNNPFWRAYDKYWGDYDENAQATKYIATNYVGGISAIATPKEFIDGDLLFTYELLIRESSTKKIGISILEPVWDTIFALSSLDENGTYYAIRYGAGIRYMKIPEKKFKDPIFMSKIMGMLKGAIGANGVYALPYTTTAGIKEEFDIASENATQIDFIQLRDLMLGSMSAQTGIPREIWLGSQIGLRSSEKNEDSYFDYLQSIQDNYRAFFKWIVYLLNSYFTWFAEDITIDIDYIKRESLDEEEKTELLGKKVDIANKAGYKVPMDYLSKQLDIKLEEKAEDPLTAFMNKGEPPNEDLDKSEKDPKEPEDKDNEE